MKTSQEYKVWIIDTDGSERLGGTFFAKSKGHALVLAKAWGLKKINSVELLIK